LNVSIGTDLSIVRPPSPLHFGPMSVCVSKTDVHYNHYEFITWWRGLMSFLHPALKSGPFPVVQTRLGRLLPSPPLVVAVPFTQYTIQQFGSGPKCRIHFQTARHAWIETRWLSSFYITRTFSSFSCFLLFLFLFSFRSRNSNAKYNLIDSLLVYVSVRTCLPFFFISHFSTCFVCCGYYRWGEREREAIVEKTDGEKRQVLKSPV
jgi:hypothetical protein